MESPLQYMELNTKRESKAYSYLKWQTLRKRRFLGLFISQNRWWDQILRDTLQSRDLNFGEICLSLQFQDGIITRILIFCSKLICCRGKGTRKWSFVVNNVMYYGLVLFNIAVIEKSIPNLYPVRYSLKLAVKLFRKQSKI